jgi:hypothetical protein
MGKRRREQDAPVAGGQGITILKNRFGADAIRFLYENYNTILPAADKPDKEETDYLSFCGHFWDPTTGKSIWGITSPNAYERFTGHAKNAIASIKTDKLKALDEFGRSLHYLEDLSEPHHASGRDGLLYPSHAIYELYGDLNKQKYPLETTNKIGQFPGTFNAYLNSAAYALATFSRQYAPQTGNPFSYSSITNPACTRPRARSRRTCTVFSRRSGKSSKRLCNILYIMVRTPRLMPRRSCVEGWQIKRRCLPA